MPSRLTAVLTVTTLSLHIPCELKGVCKFRSKVPCSSALTQTCTEQPKPWPACAFTPCWADCDAVASWSALRLCPLPSLFHAIVCIFVLLLVLSLFKMTPTQSVQCCLVSINTAELWQASWREGHGSDTFHSSRNSSQFKVNESIIHIKIRCQIET